MMFTGENTIGTILLALCSVVAVVLVWEIATGHRFRYAGPGWLPPVIAVVMFGSLLWAWFKAPRRF
ncbi:MAG: hypothetical protein ACR2J8_12705 [Thermomicrobiales bacterium]